MEFFSNDDSKYFFAFSEVLILIFNQLSLIVHFPVIFLKHWTAVSSASAYLYIIDAFTYNSTKLPGECEQFIQLEIEIFRLETEKNLNLNWDSKIFWSLLVNQKRAARSRLQDEWCKIKIQDLFFNTFIFSKIFIK